MVIKCIAMVLTGDIYVNKQNNSVSGRESKDLLEMADSSYMG